MPSEHNQLKLVCPMPQVWAQISAELSQVFRSTDRITQEPFLGTTAK